MFRRFAYLGPALGVLICSALLLNQVAEAQPSGPAISVVFAIDDSGSMHGAQGSDPQGERVVGVQRVVDVLRGFLSEEAPDRDIRIGAVSFGTDATQLAPLSSPFDASLGAQLISEDRGGTDLSEALCAAWVTATRLSPPNESGCQLSPAWLGSVAGSAPSSVVERRLVVLVTDGSPAPAGEPLPLDGMPSPGACSDSGVSPTSDGDAYLCALRNTWSVLNSTAEVDLIVIGLDRNDEWFTASEGYWSGIL